MQQQQRGKEKAKEKGGKAKQAPVQDEEDSQMEELDLDGPTQIIELVKKGIQENDVKKLIEAGYHTVEAVAFTPKKALIQVKGLSEAKVDKILEACSQLVQLEFCTASVYF